MKRDKMIHMANQIALFCQSNPDGARRTKSVADHINNFWEPRMRRQLIETLEAGDTHGVHALVVEALPAIRRPKEEERLPAKA